uniref:Uncharacterized protein n=1 Tax=Romanomermis culicivorax TaxID=13658 RepID=A0A915JEX8_ROMCU
MQWVSKTSGEPSYVTLVVFLQLDFTPITPTAIGRWYAQACLFANRQLVVKAHGSPVDEYYIAAFNQHIFMGSQSYLYLASVMI